MRGREGDLFDLLKQDPSNLVELMLRMELG